MGCGTCRLLNYCTKGFTDWLVVSGSILGNLKSSKRVGLARCRYGWAGAPILMFSNEIMKKINALQKTMGFFCSKLITPDHTPTPISMYNVQGHRRWPDQGQRDVISALRQDGSPFHLSPLNGEAMCLGTSAFMLLAS